MGKHKYIETPEKMWELFEAYRKKVEDNPRVQYSLSNKTGKAEPVYLKVPLTLEGFYNYCANSIGCVKQYFFNQDELYNDYITICSRIKDEVRQDQIEGGMVGQYNASITQRLNNLTERTDITTNNQSITGINIKIIDGDRTESDESI